MKLFVRSVPAVLFLSAASLFLIALAGCGGSGSNSSSNGSSGGNNPSGPAAQNVYALRHTQTLNGEAFDNEQDSVLVFSASATGSTTPTSTLMLPSNFISQSLAVGPTGTIYVGGLPNNHGSPAQILEYAAGSSGSAIPIVTLNAETTNGISFVDPTNLAVTSAGTLIVSSAINCTLEAFASGFTASSAPTQDLTWGDGNFSHCGAPIDVDTAGDIFYLDSGSSVIDVFAANATGATAPIRMITGTNTASFDELGFLAVDGAGDVYVTNYNQSDDPAAPSVQTNPIRATNNSLLDLWPRDVSRSMAYPHTDETDEPTEIIEFAAGASGNAMPLKRIGGSATNIVEPQAVAVDAASNLYYVDANGSFYTPVGIPLLLEVFSPSATGNVAPTASITSTGFTSWLNGPTYAYSGVAIR
jgi:hypothetical protein